MIEDQTPQELDIHVLQPERCNFQTMVHAVIFNQETDKLVNKPDSYLALHLKQKKV